MRQLQRAFVNQTTFQRHKRDSGRQVRDIILSAEVRLRSAGLVSVFCTFHAGILTLAGYVSSSPLRQLAVTLVRGMPGTEAIEDELVVVADVDSQPSSTWRARSSNTSKSAGSGPSGSAR
jgi:hypothetical protein